MSLEGYPHRIGSVHVESIDGELCVYDTARQRVHSLNGTAAFVWQRCDGRTAPAELAAALRVEASIDDAEAVVQLTLQELAAAHLLEAPTGEIERVSRRDLARGVAAATLPAIFSIVAPSPAAAQSGPLPAAPTLTSVSPNQGLPGATVAATLTGTNFVVGATTVTVNSGGVTASNVIVVSTTSLTADMVIDLAAVAGAHTVKVTTAHGTSGPQTFTVNPPPPGPPTLTSVSPSDGTRGTTVAVTLTGTNFIVGATTVIVAGGGVTATNVVVSSGTSLTANFVLDQAAVAGPRTVTVTTDGGTSGGQTFTIIVPTGLQTFPYTGADDSFVVPAGVLSITIVATGAQGGIGRQAIGGTGGLGGRTAATVSVTPGATLTIRVGGVGKNGALNGATEGGFNGGGGSAGNAGGGGGASSVYDGAVPLLVAGGGGGGGAEAGGGAIVGGGNGGAGGDVIADPGASPSQGGGGGGGGTQAAGGAGGARGSLSGADGTAGVAAQGGTGGAYQPGLIGGGGGGGGYFGGGGGGGGNPGTAGGGGGGGGSSFTAPGATGVLHQSGVKASDGRVTIAW